MATTKKAETAPEETVTISKDMLDSLTKGYEEMQAQIAMLSKQAALKDAKKNEESEKLLELVHKANAEAEELVEVHVGLGSLKSNKNLEVQINGTQYTIPKGETVKVPKKVKEVIENSLRQQDIALGVQGKYAEEAKEAIAAFKI